MSRCVWVHPTSCDWQWYQGAPILAFPPTAGHTSKMPCLRRFTDIDYLFGDVLVDGKAACCMC